MKTYRIIVSEPWDFSGPEGGNVITGVVLKALSPTFILFKSDYPLTSNGKKSSFLTLQARYEKQVLIKGDGYGGTVGIAILFTENYEDKNEEQLKKIGSYAYIGSLELQ